MTDIPLIGKLQAANTLTRRLGSILSISALAHELAVIAREFAVSERALILIADPENAALSLAAVAADVAVTNRTLTIYRHNDPILDAWARGESRLATLDELTPQSALYPLAQALNISSFYSVPLRSGSTLAGVILVDNPINKAPIEQQARELLDAIQINAEIAFANARRYSQTVAELDARVSEVQMMRQIDRELSDTIALERVFDLTVDWALRYTVAQGACLALYSAETDELRFVAELGYNLDLEQPSILRHTVGVIAQRVARSGQTEVIPDVAADEDYVPTSNGTRSHMSVPVRRDDQVIAVISVESRRPNAFTEDHVNFVAKLAARAGVAIDNARLYSEAVREREKLSHILSEIADIVIVIGLDDRVIMINQSAIAALALHPEAEYVGQAYAAVLETTPLLPAIQHAQETGQMMVAEVPLDDDRTFYAELSPQPEIGWIIVMHDITPLKRTDELKRELVATVSHDLKQPLSVMNGYLELLQMSQQLDARGTNFASMIAASIEHMRHLIDDVLDLAKIESGIELEVQAVPVDRLINDCVQGLKPLAESKAMQLDVEVSAGLPRLAGDPGRLQEIFSNLIGNAVKYTRPKGRVRVSVEPLDRNLRFMVEDNGIGISPEDQAHIFDRFYRVRRPETENIEGTGLGLAIVKKLIEAHQGQIGLESSLGVGTTFYVTLPIFSA